MQVLFWLYNVHCIPPGGNNFYANADIMATQSIVYQDPPTRLQWGNLGRNEV